MFLAKMHIFQFGLAVIFSFFITIFNGKFVFSEFLMRTCIILLVINIFLFLVFQDTQNEFIDEIILKFL